MRLGVLILSMTDAIAVTNPIIHYLGIQVLNSSTPNPPKKILKKKIERGEGSNVGTCHLIIGDGDLCNFKQFQGSCLFKMNGMNLVI